MSIAALAAPTGLSAKSRRILCARSAGWTVDEIVRAYHVSPKRVANLSCSTAGVAYRTWLESLLAEGEARPSEWDLAALDFLRNHFAVPAA